MFFPELNDQSPAIGLVQAIDCEVEEIIEVQVASLVEMFRLVGLVRDIQTYVRVVGLTTDSVLTVDLGDEDLDHSEPSGSGRLVPEWRVF